MRSVLKAFALLVLMLLVTATAAIWYVTSAGVSAKEEPGRMENFVAGRVRTMAIARRARSPAEIRHDE